MHPVDVRFNTLGKFDADLLRDIALSPQVSSLDVWFHGRDPYVPASLGSLTRIRTLAFLGVSTLDGPLLALESSGGVVDLRIRQFTPALANTTDEIDLLTKAISRQSELRKLTLQLPIDDLLDTFGELEPLNSVKELVIGKPAGEDSDIQSSRVEPFNLRKVTPDIAHLVNQGVPLKLMSAESYPDSIRYLMIQGNRLTKEDVSCFSQLPRLRGLSLNFDEIDAEAVQAITSMIQVRSISLTTDKLSPDALAPWERDCSLERLNLRLQDVVSEANMIKKLRAAQPSLPVNGIPLR
ncbi:MAG: hypothetical protein AAF664_18700 [Planctomycetota bacterium]